MLSVPSEIAPAVVVYTDGACKGNPGPGGWAWAEVGGRWASGAARHTTNQRMEITAAFEAVRAHDGPVEVVSDSTYVVNCFRDGWWKGWLARGWKNSKKEPVANRDLWEPFVEQVRTRDDVGFRWVKGHGGDPMNDLVDRLAVEAAETQRGRSGHRPPDELGPADRRPFPSNDPDGPGAAPGPSSSPLGSHAVAVFGHRPPELGGWDAVDHHDRVRARLRQILVAKAELAPDLTVVSGLRLGAELLGAEAALEANLPLVAVLPYPDPEKVWPAPAQERFRAVRDRATDVRLLERKMPEDRRAAGQALARRDAWLARNVAEAVLVWDGQDPALRRLARSLEDHLGDDVWVVDPGELTSGASRPER